MSNKTLGYITAMLCHITSQYDALKQHEPLIQLQISALCFSVMCWRKFTQRLSKQLHMTVYFCGTYDLDLPLVPDFMVHPSIWVWMSQVPMQPQYCESNNVMFNFLTISIQRTMMAVCLFLFFATTWHIYCGIWKVMLEKVTQRCINLN